MKFKVYLYNNSYKGLITDMKLLRFLVGYREFEFTFEHYQNLRIMEM